MTIKSPLFVKVGNKRVALNLNIYRNIHYQILNKAKITYKEVLKEQLIGVKFNTPITIQYTYYPKDKRISDLGNVLPIHGKFFEDSLVELGCIPDDNYKHINKVIYSFGSIDPIDPRVDISIWSTE